MSAGERGSRSDDRALPGHLRPRLTPERRRAHLAEALERFRGRRFYDAHDAWEIVWRSTTPEPRDVIQALIQITVAFHHLEDRGRPDVAARVFAKAAGRLGGREAERLGIDPAALREAVEEWRCWCQRPTGRRPDDLEIPFLDADAYR